MGELPQPKNRNPVRAPRRPPPPPARQCPPRSARVNCLSPRLEWREVSGAGDLIAGTVLRHSNELYYRARVPIRLGTVRLDAGPTRSEERRVGEEGGARG